MRSACAAFAFFLTILGSQAWAASPIGNVGTSKVDKGAFSAEVRAGYTFDADSASDDGRFRLRQHIDYGFTDYYGVRLVVEQNRFDGQELDYVSFTFENRVQLFEKDRHGWDGGFRVIYVQRDGPTTPDELDIRLMGMGSFLDDWKWRHNTVIERDIGSNGNDALALELRSQLLRSLGVAQGAVKSFGVGVEMFNDIGRLSRTTGFKNQDHQIGPVAKLSFQNGFYVQSGYRVGISEEAPDHLLKLFIGRNF